ncbi:DUF971 domain-containing protein [Paraburkholderia sabiae]|jgi:DUF971 family protein|uniref:DUF971 domain-containing protein n=1 Tax=Paraburkholderia sabiae TaxID=273251 RepID=A0ABU9Q995_9BURK|nr:DUF971 domain-containing protein [Paraburkholderia sabiae]WJZ78693.1 DUF971 domain-containing protein [Paraburkholderia sabiae]CAD6511258.1 hypothetical protein LMG24235_00445 [Paraburkholderia sabiae]CAG9207394.1 GBBH-like_N domain-containing protein [Paraburkholderia sabiae]
MNSPLHIELDMHARTLALHWGDGATQRIAYRLLRQICPCAECKRQRLDGAAPVVPNDIAVLEILPAGYGAQLRFSDGHERGIFPWSFLERLQAEE